MRGRDGEWQFPASALPMRDLLRGVMAVGFTGLTIDRYGFPHNADDEVQQLEALLGPPDVTNGFRLLAWDLRPAAASLLGGMSAADRHALAQQMLDAPRLYSKTDNDPIQTRGGRQAVCADATLTLVNPGRHAAKQDLAIKFTPRTSTARHGYVTIDHHRISIEADSDTHVFPVDLRPGNSTVTIHVHTPGVRCQSTPTNTLPTISTGLGPVTPGG